MVRKSKKTDSQGPLEYEKIWDSLKQSDSSSVFHEYYSKYRHFKRVVRGELKGSQLNFGCLQQIGGAFTKLI